MNEIDNDTLPVSDDSQDQGQTEEQLLAAVLENSTLAQEAGLVPPPVEEVDEVDPVESDEEDPESEEIVSEDDEEEHDEEEEVEDEDAGEEPATQESDVYSLDDLEDFSVMVKIDGEETAVNVQDLVKGYATEQSLSKKGRELGEARKQLDAERDAKLGELDQLGGAAAAILGSSEQALAKEYHEIEQAIEKARADGDTYEVNELKDKREQAQKKYWEARKQREGLVAAVEQQKAQVQAQQWEAQLQHFHEAIPELIPDFNEEVAGNIRQFAIDEGINPDVLDQITDPVIVKFVDDYRRLKQGVSKGTAKRKATPAKRAVPTKKAKPAAKKAADKAKMTKARAMREDASPDDQMAFLRDYASRSLSNL